MHEPTQKSVPAWFWVLSAIALMWNLVGVVAYLMQVGMSAEDLAALTEAERNLFTATPVWVTGAFAVAVFGGALGCLALLLRKSLAIPILAISLLGAGVQNGHAFFLSDVLTVYGTQAIIMPALVILTGSLLVWFAFTSTTKGWLGR